MLRFQKDVVVRESKLEVVHRRSRAQYRTHCARTLDELGSLAAIRRRLTDPGDRAALKTRLAVAGDERRLQPDAELGLYRIVQEALRNVERHAAATSVVVKVGFENPSLVVVVVGNGAGFVPEVETADQA